MPEQFDAPPITMNELAIWLHEYYTALINAGHTHAWAMEYLIGLSRPPKTQEINDGR
jgi:hypothetical protein